MKQLFRILDHTADVGFECRGKTLEELFANAARALVHFFVDLETIKPREEMKIEVTGDDRESLLVNFLSEILFQIDSEARLFSDFEVSIKVSIKVSIEEGESLTAVAITHGEKWDRSRHIPKLLVKAITYHQLKITQQRKGIWRARVFVDI